MKELTDKEYESINPKIRNTVKKLRYWGFDTTDSGDGETSDFACDNPFPYVVIKVDPIDLIHETNRLVDLLSDYVDFNNCPHPQDNPDGAAKHPAIEASYLPTQGGYATILLINVVL